MEYFKSKEREEYLLDFDYNNFSKSNEEKINLLINNINDIYNYIKDIKIYVGGIFIKGRKEDKDEMKNDYYVYENDIKDLLFVNVFNNLDNLLFNIETKEFGFNIDKKTTISFTTKNNELNKEFVDKIMLIMEQSLLISNLKEKINDIILCFNNLLSSINKNNNEKNEDEKEEKKDEIENKYKLLLYDIVKDLEYFIKYMLIIQNLNLKNNINNGYKQKLDNCFNLCKKIFLEKRNINDVIYIDIIFNDIYNILISKTLN